ncbi:MAG: hypothetical protein SXQ77_03155 [Halobacteria archaeon]|nr:hypothetical protein [Halobacteria archaeon]
MKGDKYDNNNDNDTAVSISVGFILNMGVAAVFIASIFLVLQGVLAEDPGVKENQMERVGSQVMSNLVEIDKIAQTEGNGTAYFTPPTSSLDSYRVTIQGVSSCGASDDGIGNITVYSEGKTVDIQYRTATKTVTQVQFTESSNRVIATYNGSCIQLR